MMPEYQFFDSHCHIDFSEFDVNRDVLLQQALNSGINKMLVPGITLAQLNLLLDSHTRSHLFKGAGAQFYFSIGLHPYFLSEHKADHIEAIEQLYLLNRDKIVAIGECGIDSSINDIEKQMKLTYLDCFLTRYIYHTFNRWL